jgi:hypothetical protein
VNFAYTKYRAVSTDEDNVTYMSSLYDKLTYAYDRIFVTNVTVTKVGHDANVSVDYELIEVHADTIPNNETFTAPIPPEIQHNGQSKLKVPVELYPDDTNWVGEGDLGSGVDTNISRKRGIKRLDW